MDAPCIRVTTRHTCYTKSVRRKPSPNKKPRAISRERLKSASLPNKIHSTVYMDLNTTRSFTTRQHNVHQSHLHGALAGAGRGGGGGSGGSLGKQGLAAKLVGTVLSAGTRLLKSHLCCSSCRSLFIWTQKRQTDFLCITSSCERALQRTMHLNGGQRRTTKRPFLLIKRQTVRSVSALIARNNFACRDTVRCIRLTCKKKNVIAQANTLG